MGVMCLEKQTQDGWRTYVTNRVCTPTPSSGLVGGFSFFFIIERIFCFCAQKALTHLTGYNNPG